MCDERHRLIDYVYGEGDDQSRALVETHLEQCATCREEISGLRGVRQDLLAWEVPEHPSVWRPFVAAQPTPWWREVPAWALAAAASIVFLLGAAGGVVTHAFMVPERSAVAQDAQAVPSPADALDVKPQLNEMEQRIVSMMRNELNQRVQLTAMRASRPGAATGGGGITADQIEGLIDQSEQRTLELLYGLNNGLDRIQKNGDSQVQRLRNEIRELRDLVQQQSGGR